MNPDHRLPLYNLDTLQKIAHGDETFVKKMIRIFLEQSAQSVQELKSAYQTNNMEVIERTAHRMKTSIDNMGIEQLKQEIRLLEQKAQGKSVSEDLPQLMRLVEERLNTVCQQLRSLL